MSTQSNHRLYVCHSIYLDKTTSRSVCKSVLSACNFLSLEQPTSMSTSPCVQSPALSAHFSVPYGAVVTLFGRGSESRARICKRLRSPEIESKESIRPGYVTWGAVTRNRVVVPARQATYCRLAKSFP
jgi:hypothetical protein